jgi:methanogenic corrinoid protein MtbC1
MITNNTIVVKTSAIQDLSQAIETGKILRVPILIEEALDDGVPFEHILEQGIIDSMFQVQARYDNGFIHVSQVLCSVKAMMIGVDTLKSHITKAYAKDPIASRKTATYHLHLIDHHISILQREWKSHIRLPIPIRM